MDQNNFNTQGNENNNQTPQQQNFYYQPPMPNNYGQAPQYSYDYSQQAAYGQYPENSANDARIAELAGAAFGRALASVIIPGLPISSIISIVLGSKALKLTRQADELAAACGKRAGGKNIAAKILGKIGKIAGISFTVFWGVYILIIGMVVAIAIMSRM